MTTSGSNFRLHDRLAADSANAGSLPLSDLRLLEDARFFWLLLVPRRAGVSELHDLSPADQTTLMQEITCCARSLKEETGCAKINIAAFGNMVPQLHVHIIARHENDPAWPGGAIGHGIAEPCGDALRQERLGALARMVEAYAASPA